MIVVGVDPGGRHSAVVSRRGDEVTAAAVLKRTTGGKFPDRHYIHEVLGEIAAQLEHGDVLALEGLYEPRGRTPDGEEAIMTTAGIIGTGIIYGAVIGRWPHAVIVPPGGNGSLPDRAYPPAIRRYERLGGPTIHARSAYDVAGVGKMLYRTEKSNLTRGR